MKKNEILFNKYKIKNNEISDFYKCIKSNKISANNIYQKKCQKIISKFFKFKNNFITHSCTSALEAAALIIDIKKGDEVIIPSFNFVTSAAVFANLGAKINFVDSNIKTFGASIESIRKKITPKTKAIVVMHYASIGSEIEEIKKLCNKNKIYLIEDAAQCIGSQYKNKFLGGYGDLSTFSFHETKNISCGEGGLLVINNKKLLEKAKVVCLKGTNRINYEEKKLNYYSWIDKGFSALASDITCSILYGQLPLYKKKNDFRKKIWLKYHNQISNLKHQNLFDIPSLKLFKNSNYHIFYLLFKLNSERDKFINFMNSKNIKCIFHYLPLHKSLAGKKFALNFSENLKNAEKISNTIVRLPLHNHLKISEQNKILKYIKFFVNKT